MDILELVDFPFYLSPIMSIARFWTTFRRFHRWRMIRTTRRMNLNPWSSRRKVTLFLFLLLLILVMNFLFFRET
jgi:hypothetical protein